MDLAGKLRKTQNQQSQVRHKIGHFYPVKVPNLKISGRSFGQFGIKKNGIDTPMAVVLPAPLSAVVKIGRTTKSGESPLSGDGYEKLSSKKLLLAVLPHLGCGSRALVPRAKMATAGKQG